jgi:hypothetical protein
MSEEACGCDEWQDCPSSASDETGERVGFDGRDLLDHSEFRQCVPRDKDIWRDLVIHSRSDDDLSYPRCEADETEECDGDNFADVFSRLLGYEPTESESPLYIENLINEITAYIPDHIERLGEYVGLLTTTSLRYSELRPVVLRQIELLGLISLDCLQMLNIEIVRQIIQLIAHSSELPDLLDNAKYWGLMMTILIAYGDEIVRNAALIVCHNIAIREPLNQIICKSDAEEFLGVIVADSAFLTRKSIAYVIFDIGIIWSDLLIDRLSMEIIEMVNRREDGKFSKFVRNTLIAHGDRIGVDLRVRNIPIDYSESFDDPLVRLWDMIAHSLNYIC